MSELGHDETESVEQSGDRPQITDEDGSGNEEAESQDHPASPAQSEEIQNSIRADESSTEAPRPQRRGFLSRLRLGRSVPSSSSTSPAEEPVAIAPETTDQLDAPLISEPSEAPESPDTDARETMSEATGTNGDQPYVRDREQLKAAIEALIFVSEEPITAKQLAAILGDPDAREVDEATTELLTEFNRRPGGLEIRQIAGGYRLSTRPEFHEEIRRYLRTRPSARLPLASLETLAVIAYKQPITLPEIQEIRGKNSASSVKTLLERRLIVPKGRKPVVGRPMMYGTSKEFLVQFGMNDLAELPSIEDFEDLATE